MTRLQAIENALLSINQAAFQELCDSFLLLRNNNYSSFSRTGSQDGKQKTIKGTPDTFLLLPNGRFVFVEYSTNLTAGVSKLMDDIKKCIDQTKTGIPLNQIAEIILCVNFNLKAEEVQNLIDLLATTRIVLTLYTLDALSLELHLHHRDLAHLYLGLPLDTGQIVSIETFIIEYNRASQGISTPLDNTFLHRQNELKELKESIHNFDFIIITGAAGIGKTKLSLEGINSFLTENLSFTAYCVSYKSHTLLDDLYQYFDSEKDYLLFVDDANRIDAFNQITGFYKSARKGKLKIIITVRDYAFQEIGILCQEFIPKRINIVKFSDEQIIDIIKANPFEILNPDYQKEIVRIADGNPRLAIMTALLAKAEQNIYALFDVSDLFEKYFSTFIKDDGEFASKLNIKCLGLIAFFYTIPFKNKEVTASILNNFEIDYSEFIEVIDNLDKLELVEIQFEHVKIPEQNLSTYFFYKAFIKDNHLSFYTLLNKFFESNSNRFRECVIPANNTFGHQNVMDKLQPDLRKYLLTVKGEGEKAFKFLSTFWYYLQTEALAYVFNLVESLPIVSTSKYEVTYANNAFSYNQNNIVELLGEFFRFPNNLKDALELAFEYTRKKPDHLPELIHKIREQLIFDQDDEPNGFPRQNILYDILLKGISGGDALHSTVFYEFSKTFLSFKFQHTKGGRNHSFYWYYYPIPNVPIIQQFRKRIWECIDTYFDRYPNDSLHLLESYASVSPDVIKEIMEFDLPFLINIIEKHLSPDSFEHCRYVQEQISWCKRNSLAHQSFSLLSQRFRNQTYDIYLKIDWNRLRDKEEYEYEFKNYREYERLKEAEIRTSFVFVNNSEVVQFYDTFVYLQNAAENKWNYLSSLDFIIDENCSKNFALGLQIMQLIISKGNELKYIPRIAFYNHLKTKETTNAIWEIIHATEFTNKSLWEFSFFENLDETLINSDYAKALILTVSKIIEPSIVQFDRLERFTKIEPNIFQIILKIIVDKNEFEGTRLQVWMDFFDTHFDKLGDDLELIKKAYLQQSKIHSHFDHGGKGFLKILRKDLGFLVEYVNSLYSDNHFGVSADHRDLSFVWQVENIESGLIDVFDFVIEREPYYGILDHFCNSFFRNLQNGTREKAKIFLLEYCKINFHDFNKMNIVVDIARHSMSELFEEILLFFITLNQDVEVFSKIFWRGNGASGIGDVILADIEMSDWKKIQSIVEKSEVGIKLLPIKKYLNGRIESCERFGDLERQRRFLEHF